MLILLHDFFWGCHVQQPCLKTFGQFIRPCLGCTMILLHGFAALVCVSEPHLAHDSSWTCEIVSHALNVLKSQFPNIDVRKVHLSCHGDNSSKELKNNSLLRLLSACVSQRRLHSASLSTLMSGHSHEDIDQCFSSLTAHYSELSIAVRREGSRLRSNVYV